MAPLLPLSALARQPQQNPAEHARDGFTLLEIIIVLAVLGVLVSILTPRMFPFVDDAKRLEATTSWRASSRRRDCDPA